MIKRIEIDELNAGMLLYGLSLEADSGRERFEKPVRIKSNEEIERYKSNGYMFGYIFFDSMADIPVALKDAVEVNDRLENISALPEFDGEGQKKKVTLSSTGHDGETEAIEAWELTPEEEALYAETSSSGPGKGEDEKSFNEILDLVDFDEEIEKAQSLKRDAQTVAGDLLSEVRAGKGIEPGKAKDVVDSMVDSVFNNQDALLSLSRLKDYDNYTFTHSVNVSILALALGRRLNFSRDDLGMLGMGGILHDVGKMLVPDNILNKPGVLTEKEFKEMKNHVTYGVDLLGKSRDIDDKSIYLASQHHERVDGSGYPTGMPGADIHLFGRIGSICDVYDAMTTKRAYGDTPSPAVALKRIYGWKGQNFDPDLVDRFIMCLGIYPIGGLVKLDSGEIGVVRSANRNNLLKPKVLVFQDDEGKRYTKPFEVDFAGTTERQIVEALDQSILPLDLEIQIEE
ncbi:MAG: HD-GYP domain-containing protein [Thermodesulfobacteriota bacterium]